MHPARILALILAVGWGPPEASCQTPAGQEQAPGAAVPAPQPQPAAGERILWQVNFYGLSRVPEERARAMLTAAVGKPYAQADQELDKGRLLASGEFDSVEFRVVGLGNNAIRLDIEVKEAAPKAAIPARPEAADWKPVPVSTAPARGVRVGPVAPWQIRPTARAASGELEPPWVIGYVVVEGTRSVSYNTVRAQVKARVGDVYYPEDRADDIRKLMQMGSFDRAAIVISSAPDKPVPAHLANVAGSTYCVRLTIQVEEKPLVRRIRFEGNKALSRGRLSDAATLKEKDPLDLYKLRTDADKMLELYREKGYLSARIEPRVDPDTAAARADIAFVVLEGPRTLIQEVVIEGATVFKPRKILKLMSNRRKKVLQEAKLPEDIRKIQAYYKNKGYFHFEVSTYTVTVTTDGTRAGIRLVLSEGRRERFGTTSFAGNTVYVSSELARTVDYRRGKIFSQERFDLTIHNIQNLYADKGYIRALVAPATSYNEATGELDIVFDIAEDRVVYVDYVGVEGFRKTKPWVFTRELVLKKDQPFSSSKARKSQQKIMNLGFIDDVSLSFQPTQDPDRVDVTFDVVEGRPGMLTAGAGFSSLDGLVGTLSMQHLNMLGRAYRTSVAWSFGARVQDYSLTWLTPWVRGKPVSLGFDLFNTRRVHPFESSSSAFVNRKLGGAIRVGPRFQDDKYQLSFVYTFQKVGITNIAPDFVNRLSEGTSIHSSLGVEFARDTRDNFFDPTEGTRHSIGMTTVGGPFFGNIHFWKPYLLNSIHFRLLSVEDYPLVLSFGNRTGYVTQFGETKTVPVFDRYFLGGQDSLRGYAPTGQVGRPDGGKVYDVFNVELGFPLARERRKTIVMLVGFFDAGSTWDRMKDVNWRVGTGERDVKTDVGFGIRFVTPAFPIRLDYGYGLNHRPGERLYEINFGIGSLF